MQIDDQRQHVLTKYQSLKGYRKQVESDHNSMYASFTLQYDAKKLKIRREIFEFKNIEGQKKFHFATHFSTKFMFAFQTPGTKSELIIII